MTWTTLLLGASLTACGGGDAAVETAVGAAAAPAAATPVVGSSAVPPVVLPGTWVVMGSSTAAGSGAAAGRAWVASVQSAYATRSLTIVNLAKGGTTTYAGLPGATASTAGRPAPDPAANIDAVLATSARLLLLSYPTNDAALGYTQEETMRNLLAIRGAALAQGMGVLVLSSQPRALPAAQLALMQQQDLALAGIVGPCFVPVRALLASPAGTLDPRVDSGDGVHPNDAGHALIATAVRQVLDGGLCVNLGQ